jgi:hypothetical protein
VWLSLLNQDPDGMQKTQMIHEGPKWRDLRLADYRKSSGGQ